ncbi:MAG: hypothetical protein KDA86_08430 [Planctomycetaceae bacterium]|nr:hypothetical protein [Planctomycetaceae bacterium]
MKLYFLALGTLLIVCVGCAGNGHEVFHKDEYHAPPAAMLAAPGPMVAGPGPGVMGMGPGGMIPGPPGGGYGAAPDYANKTSQVRFLGPEGMAVGWQIDQGFAENQVIAPGRYNFNQGALYRLKVTGIPGREGLVLYPTLAVYPTNPSTDAYLSHNSLPIRITDEDLDQVETSNFVTKVVYLPDPKFQDLAIAGVEELVSTRLDPGLNPVAEADRRGAIMAVLRVGNMDLEMPGSEMLGGLQQTGHVVPVDGYEGQHVAPVPVGGIEGQIGAGIPSNPLVSGKLPPGAYANLTPWGMPRTGTPIGLPGPPHLPYGRPAGLKSHTVRNLTDVDLAPPVDHMLIDVRHEPGISLPHPVKHIEYTEQHPVYGPGEVSCPPGQGAGY